ncbi:HNH endonuclease signature motif containing protein [Micromonospora profundi]|uniref:HNH endonuclease signature motif containing protein n=1 Tax=Micromonospora profundi TaxID=1420889 RepID=UPI0036581D59
MANLTDPDRKRLWARSGNQCAFPGCRQELVESAVQTAPHGVVIGDEAHIVAEADGGPRGSSGMPIKERNSYANMILLCPTHHRLIDKEEGVHFSVELLQEMKRNHERMVISGQTRTDHSVTRENMYTLATMWATKAGLDDWPDWTSWLLGVQPSIKREKLASLRKLAEWLLGRYWPEAYPGTKKSMANFLNVLADFNRYVSDIGHGKGDELIVRQYQHEVEGWDPPLYRQALKRFDEESRSVAELVVELSRAANFVCDEVRTEVNDQFRLTQGKILIQVQSGLGTKTLAPEYSLEEREAPNPYPGIAAFAEARASRDFYFPGPGRFEHVQFGLD